MIKSGLSPEQWDEAFELFDGLRDKPDAERRSILQNQCAGKPALRAAVEDLLRAHDSKGSFLDVSGLGWDAVSPVQQLQPGQTFAQYRLIELIGQGGMGIVWKAEDQRLRRVVALKFINAALVNYPSEKARFFREAQAVAKLHHPNICTIYEINEADGLAWIAMAFLDGQTVAQRISAGPFDIREALDTVAQTASGLEHAHRSGVVHRDIKPANLMLTQGTSSRWHLTLMDFGLARLADRSQLTQGRFVGGTIAYMAPEQLAAAPCDGRADLWALGAVLYEMISGRRPFAGPVDQVLVDLIANGEPPPLTSLRTGVPIQMDWIVDKALAKKPEQRYQSAADLIADLRRLSERLDTGNALVSTHHSSGRRLLPVSASRSPRLRRIWIGTALLAAIAAVAISLGFWLAQRDPSVNYTFQQITFDGGIAWRPALSPDGRLLAYASDRGGDGNLDIWVQHLDTVSPPLRVTRDPGEDTEPEFTADGASIVFRSTRRNGGLYIVPSLGGEERLLGPGGSNPKISRDGKFLVYAGEGHRLMLMSLRTRKAEVLQPELLETVSPVWLPDSRRLLARGLDSKTEVWDWYLISVEDRSYVRVGALEQLRALNLNEPEPLGWAPGRNRVVFSARAGLSSAPNLWEIGISPRSGKLQNPPRRLTTGANETHAHISRSGSVALAIRNARVDIWSVPLDGPDHTSRGVLQRLTTRATQNLGAAISRDGDQLAFLSGRRIWSKDLKSGKERLISAEFVASEDRPVLSRDGQYLAFRAHNPVTGGRTLSAVLKGREVPESLCTDCGVSIPWGWSQDGNQLLYQHDEYALHLRVIAPPRSVELLRDRKFNIYQASFSPDQRWLLFLTHSMGAGNPRIFAAPFNPDRSLPATDWIAITDGKAVDDKPRWALDGNGAFFRSNIDSYQCIWFQALAPDTKQPVGEPVPVRHFHDPRLAPPVEGNYENELAVAADILVLSLEEPRSEIWLMKMSR